MTSSYRAHIELDRISDHVPVVCGDCGWRASAAEVSDIKEAYLTPGDPSPIGRCPKCQSLVYPLE